MSTSGLICAGFEGVEPTDDEVQVARETFAVLLVQMEQADWFSAWRIPGISRC